MNPQLLLLFSSGSRWWRPHLAVALAGAAALALTTTGQHSMATSAQVGPTPPPTATPWPMPTEPALQYAQPIWLNPADQLLATLPSGTITVPCARNNFNVTVTPEAPSYPRGTAAVFRVSIAFTGPHPCVIGSVDIPAVIVYDSNHNAVWVDGGKYEDARPGTPVGQLSEAGDTLIREVWWPQDDCYFGHCPDTEAPSGTYTVVAAFPPYGRSQPATVQIG